MAGIAPAGRKPAFFIIEYAWRRLPSFESPVDFIQEHSMIHLIGVNHIIQYKNNIVPLSVFADFREFLAETAKGVRASLLAEEFHEEYLGEVYFSPEGTVKAVADTLGIEHRYCDPGDAERKDLGIPYYADIRDEVLEGMKLRKNYILDPEIVKRVRARTDDLVQSYFPLRENFWLERLGEDIAGSVVFICGHEHITSFKKLLQSHDIAVEVIVSFWRREYFELHTQKFL